MSSVIAILCSRRTSISGGLTVGPTNRVLFSETPVVDLADNYSPDLCSCTACALRERHALANRTHDRSVSANQQLEQFQHGPGLCILP